MQVVLVINHNHTGRYYLPADIAAKVKFSVRLINRVNPAMHHYQETVHPDC